MFGFGNKAKKYCSKEDVKGFLLLFFGREAKHESDITRRAGKPVAGVLSGLINSKEFIYGVLQPLALGKPLAWMPYTAEQQKLVIRTAKKHFGIKLKAADHRTKILIAISNNWRFLQILDNGPSGYSASDFARRIESHFGQDPNRILGAIEDIRGNECFGYALDLDRKEESLQLDFYLNGTYIGTSDARDLRRDVEEKHPGFKYTGFSFTVTIPAHLAKLDHLVLAVFDHASGTPICPARSFPNMGTSYALNMVRFTNTLQQAMRSGGEDVTAQIAQIQSELPDLKNYAAIPIPAYQSSKHLLKEPLPAQGMRHTNLTLHAGEGLKPITGAKAFFQKAVSEKPEAVIFFADHEWMADTGTVTPVLKHAFDYEELLTRAAYPMAFAVKAGVFPEGTSPHTMWLAAYEKLGAKAFSHVPHILFEAQSPCMPSVQDYQKAVTQHLRKTAAGAELCLEAEDRYADKARHTGQITWPLPDENPLMAIIIPTRDALELTRNCIKSLRNTLQHSYDTEIIIVDNGSEEEDTKEWLRRVDAMDGIRVLLHDAPFNWAELNNLAVEATEAEYLLFLNNDTIALDYGWDHILRGYLNRPDIGAVGARLLFEDGTVQFGGYVLDTDNIVLKEAYGESPNQSYNQRSQLPRQTSALIGAFLACRRSTYIAAGGFDAANLPVAFNDVDFSLSVQQTGLKNIYVPAITFQHLESKSRGYDAQDKVKDIREKREREKIREKWRELLVADPYYSPVLLAQEPTHASILKHGGNQ